MANQAKMVNLVEWLRSHSGYSGSSSHKPSSSSAQAIIQSWAELRNSYQLQSFQPQHLEFLRTLINSKTSLHVADPQAKLIISFLFSPNISLPRDSYPLFLRLLYIWTRKSSKHTSSLVDSAVEALSRLFSSQIDLRKSPFIISEGVLLLGALTCVPTVSQRFQRDCFELLCDLLEEACPLTVYHINLIPEILAGIGYALSSSKDTLFNRILGSLLRFWSKEGRPCACISNGLMILHLVEWVLTVFFASRNLENIDVFAGQFFGASKQYYVPFTFFMAAAGVLRATNRSLSGLPVDMISRLRIPGEKIIEDFANDVISKTEGFTNFHYDPSSSFYLQCLSLALSRSGPVSCSPPVFLCLASALLTENFPLRRFYTRILGHVHGKLAHLELDEVKNHLGSVIFKEAGAATRVLCNQYILVDDENKNAVESLVWTYCKDIYSWHQQAAFFLSGKEDELLMDLEKIAESAFLMVVVFALAVTKNRLTEKFTQESQMQISVEILISFSCVEYFRRMRLSEYTDTIRAVVVSIQENESACVAFVESMPSYTDLTNQKGLKNKEYAWCSDDVQTARMLFYLRVLPTCIERLPLTIFREVVVPTMFLYMGHLNGKVAWASHSVFIAFMSSGKDLDHDERKLLKEQLVFYYVQRSLSGFPGITPFEGLASGVAALVSHLPAASPAIFYCIHNLIQKANELFRDDLSEDVDLWKNWQGESKASKRIIGLLLRLTTLVDIQVLPNLMKLLAGVIIQLPNEGQNLVLGDMRSLVAESDDVTRKPLLVSWLQSLSYLCSRDSSEGSAGSRSPSIWNMVGARL